MNVPVDWPETVTVSTCDLVAVVRFINDGGKFTGDEGWTQRTTDALRAWGELATLLDENNIGWE